MWQSKHISETLCQQWDNPITYRKHFVNNETIQSHIGKTLSTMRQFTYLKHCQEWDIPITYRKHFVNNETIQSHIWNTVKNETFQSHIGNSFSTMRQSNHISETLCQKCDNPNTAETLCQQWDNPITALSRMTECKQSRTKLLTARFDTLKSMTVYSHHTEPYYHCSIDYGISKPICKQYECTVITAH